MALVVTALVASACTSDGDEDAAPTTTPSSTPTPTPAPAPAPDDADDGDDDDPPSAGALAPRVTGLMTRQGLPPAGWDLVDSAVIHVQWDELEGPDQVFDGPGWDVIDDAVADRRDLRLKLRVMAGVHAPAFVKALGGPAVPDPTRQLACEDGGIAVVNGFQPRWRGCVPYFWQDEALDQYDELMAEVARRYDDEEAVAAVVSSACMTVFAEPFLRAQRDATSNQRLLAAGLDHDADEACQRRSLEIHAERFSRTAVALAVNGWDRLVPLGSAEDVAGNQRADARVTDWDATAAFLDDAVARYGEQLELQNNGLGPTDGCAQAGNAYCYLQDTPVHRGFQTEAWSNLGSFDALVGAVERAIELGACFVELPGRPQPFTAAELAELAPLDRQLEAACR